MSKSPGKVRPNYEAGLAYSKRENGNLAFFYLRKAKDIDASFFYAKVFRRADNLQQAGRLDEAINEYKKLLRWAPNDPVVLNRLGNVYFLKGLLSEAEKTYREAIRLKPTFSEAHGNLGIVYGQMDILDKAVQEFQTAMRLAPGDPTPHAELGRTYAQMGLIEDALAEIRAALKLDPQHENARRYLEQIMQYRDLRND